MYETETKDAILDRMLSQISDGIDKRQGSVTWDMLSPTALELEHAYIQLGLVLSFGFLSENTPSEYVDLRAQEQGVYRRPSVKAKGELTFYGTDGQVIEVGSRVSTDEPNPTYFITTKSGVINDGQVKLTAESEIGGLSGNVAPSKISLVLGDLSGVVSVTNSEAFDGGVDTESDESLIARYIDKLRNPATSGNANHYVQWAKEVVGVGEAKVFPLWAGAGTVKVVIVDSQMRPASAELVAATAQYIEDHRPINASVTVVSSPGKAVNVNASVTLANGVVLQSVKDAFSVAVESYLQSIAFKQNYISTAKIGALLLATDGVLDYGELSVNGSATNVQLAEDEAPFLNTVNISV